MTKDCVVCGNPVVHAQRVAVLRSSGEVWVHPPCREKMEPE